MIAIHKSVRPSAIAFLGWLCWLGTLGTAQQPPVVPSGYAEHAVLQGMYLNGLHDSAIAYCRAQRGHTDPASESEARWVMWEIESLAEKASTLPSDQAEPLWDEMLDIVEDFSELQPPRPRSPWVKWQGELGQLLRTQVGLARLLASPADNDLRAAILARVRENLERLEALQREITEQVQIAAARRSSLPPTAGQLAILGVEVSLLEAESLLVRNRCYPPGSSDSIAALSEMLERVRLASSQVSEDWSGRPRLNLAKATALSQLGRDDEAMPLLKNLVEDSDAAVANRAASIAAEILQNSGRLSAADQVLDNRGDWESSPELALARLNWMLANIQELKSRSSSNINSDSNINSKLQEALDLRTAIGKRFGGYWQQRAEAVLVVFSGANSAAASDNQPSNTNTAIELILVEVRQFLAADRWQDAANSLDRGVQLAKDANDISKASQLSSVAAALAQQYKDWSQARKRFEKTATDFPELESSPKMMLTAAWCASQELANATTAADRTKVANAYTAILESHIKRFPQSAERLTAIKWLSDWYRSQKQHRKSAAAWREIADTEPTLELSLANLMQDYLAIAYDQRLSYVDRINELEAADNWLQAIADNISRDIMVKRRVDVMREALLQLAPRGMLTAASKTFKYQLQDNPSDTEACIAFLADFIRQIEDGSNDSNTIKALGSSLEQAIKSDRLQAADTRIRFAAVWRTVGTLDAMNPKDRQPIIPLLGQLVDWYKATTTDSDTLPGKVLNARFLAWQGNTEKAVESFKTLQANAARDPWLAIQAGNFQTELGEAGLTKAIDSFRQIAAGSNAGQWPWVEARFQTMLVYRWQSEPKKAQQLAKLILATEADLPTTWKALFQQQAAATP